MCSLEGMAFLLNGFPYIYGRRVGWGFGSLVRSGLAEVVGSLCGWGFSICSCKRVSEDTPLV